MGDGKTLCRPVKDTDLGEAVPSDGGSGAWQA